MPYITEEQRLKNRQRILRSTYHLFIREGERLTTQMICSHAGIGKGTLFHYFESKERLLYAAYQEAAEHARKLTWRSLDLTGSKRDIIRQLLLNSMQWPLEYPEEVIFSSRYNDMMHHDLYNPDFSKVVTGALDAPGVWERLLENMQSDVICKYAKNVANTQMFHFALYLTNQPELAKNDELIDYVVDRITACFE